MVTDRSQTYKELTSELLCNLLSQLPDDAEADGDLLKRAVCRWTLRAPAELHVQNPDGSTTREYVSIRDISVAGVGLVSKKPVDLDTVAVMVLPLEDGYYKVNLKIAHCTQTVGELQGRRPPAAA